MAFQGATTVLAVRAAGALNPIEVENALPGTPAPILQFGVSHAVEGYASETSALPGDTLHLHVSTAPGAPYRIEVYRLGWYGGEGSRLIGCVPSCSGSRPGQQLPVPAPDANGLVQADWPVTDRFTLPSNATSGYYRVRFVLLDGRASSTFVIVRPPPGYQAKILVQVPVNTWQAYNPWGGRALYNEANSAEANRVSFDRPLVGLSLSGEYPLVLFMEKAGYDVAYQTDVDTDRDPSSLLGYKLVIAVGHGEYWTSGMRDAFDAARDAGVNLAFMGSNDAYWQVRYESNDRVIVGYKSTDDPVKDPSLETILFRSLDPPRQECELMGIQHQGGALNWPPGDYSIVPSSLDHPWFDGTGFDASSVLKRLVGVETDTIPSWDGGASCGHDLTVFFHREMRGDMLGNADATAYTAPSGAVVFAAGSRQLVWGLADGSAMSGVGGGLVDPRLQRFVTNMLDDLSAARSADLGVELAPDDGAVSSGAVKVDADISNDGPDGVQGATLNLTLPPGVTFVRVAAKGVTCTLSPLLCHLSGIAAGSAVRAVFTLRPTGRAAATVMAHVYAHDATDPDPRTGTARLTLRPVSKPKPKPRRFR